MEQLKSVISISRIPSSDLSGVVFKRSGIVRVPETIKSEVINIQVPARLSIINKVEGKATLWETTLVFHTCQDLSECDKHYCYIATLANGKRILVGNGQRPYPKTVTSDNLSENVKDSQLQEVTITLKHWQKPPIIL